MLLLCVQTIAQGLLGGFAFRSLDNGAVVQEARKHIRDVNNIAGVVIGSRLRSNNAGPSVFCLVLSA